jgi:hypothetical protein
MYGWIFKKIGWKFFAAGAATAIVGSRYVRPAMVTVVKGGMNLTNAAANTWNEAKAQTSKLVAEASEMRHADSAAVMGGDYSADIMSELRALRADIASVKAEMATKAPA